MTIVSPFRNSPFNCVLKGKTAGKLETGCCHKKKKKTIENGLPFLHCQFFTIS